MDTQYRNILDYKSLKECQFDRYTLGELEFIQVWSTARAKTAVRYINKNVYDFCYRTLVENVVMDGHLKFFVRTGFFFYLKREAVVNIAVYGSFSAGEYDVSCHDDSMVTANHRVVIEVL